MYRSVYICYFSLWLVVVVYKNFNVGFGCIELFIIFDGFCFKKYK